MLHHTLTDVIANDSPADKIMSIKHRKGDLAIISNDQETKEREVNRLEQQTLSVNITVQTLFLH